MKSALALAATVLLAGCGGGSGGAPAAPDESEAAPSLPEAGNGPDTSGLADVILGRIDEDPTRQEQKARAKFECRTEYVNQGAGWQAFGPMGIYPL